ncbi:hypothetical protein A1Q1_05641 [Trichosporon asahii var. asahii CBS 2479]|uniref:F-box domain-containing protein n=1 Tax=Trichosporon asahii var. asahii (strain ATCC 90039 / CBS 2479 / JCM 2466 / KCTC 7840 / NBRC 103889/ NCYC 2677 / UAMH 7654) TaxID=1186058 RepID=J5SJC4_TRIAS|nr:hypothetical protein A1Q1_05641 [Trichosporon asahii var. asahii CBS 2479]EJT45916.1 hypothetical protein A1Q1_05641 [Trichosporon asahii var. asahii CBS 2479]
MPETSVIPTTPRLPAELLLSIFNYLRRHDLAQVSKANSYLRNLARPFFYRFATLSKFGLFFPGARRPYPFLETPGSGPKPCSRKRLKQIASEVREIDIPPHPASDCAIFCNMRMEELPCEAKVLRLGCAVRVVNEDDSPPPKLVFTHTEEHAATSEHNGNDYRCRCCLDDPCSACRQQTCFFYSLASSMPLEKVVILDTAMGVDDTFDEEQHLDLYPSEEFVTVLYSHDITENSDCVYNCKYVRPALRPYWGTKQSTVILWTGAPGRAWKPPCDVHQPSSDTPLHSLALAQTETDGNKLLPECHAMNTLWRDLGDQLGTLMAREDSPKLRIVNATAIVEKYIDPADRAKHENRRANITEIEASIKRGFKTYRHKRGGVLKEQVEFLTMEEWIALGEWEDVFTRNEMEPFLTAGPSSAPA